MDEMDKLDQMDDLDEMDEMPAEHLRTITTETESLTRSDEIAVGHLHTLVEEIESLAGDVNQLSLARHSLSSTATRQKGEVDIDPLRIVAKEMDSLTDNINQLLVSEHPSLNHAATYYTKAEGKRMRPMIVFLMSIATALCPKAPWTYDLTEKQINSSIAPIDVIKDGNPSTSLISNFSSPPDSAEPGPGVLPSQRRVAEITELIHTASLLHDDVIDHSISRRGSPSGNIEFGNKVAVLAGDFLLGRASVALVRIRNAEVAELFATVLANLVEGEFMQMKNTIDDEQVPQWSEAAFSYYIEKTYLKTASLISKSCRAAALLSRASATIVSAAYAYGKYLGLAFQLVDDLLDYTRSNEELGKPAGADLELGLATAPLLFAWETHPELGALIGRKFAQEGDVARAREVVGQSDGVEKTRALAKEYCERAIAALDTFPKSDAKDGLVKMAMMTLHRKK
ncbi:histidine kinase 3 [Apiospora kogelbergensis]|uniref:Histidine kinase 3 n=1 Tax=Apiospora kogelbergensis TaxID=1337665 RepID=A0AAW0R235_9PEZI